MKKLTLLTLTIGGALLLSGLPAFGQLTSFGTFAQTGAGTPFSFVNNGLVSPDASATLAAATAVTFTFLNLDPGLGLNGTYDAFLELEAITTEAASVFGPVIVQPIGPGSGTITFDATSGPFSGSNLLTVDFTGGLLRFEPGSVVSLQASTAALPPDTVSFGSDLLTFDPAAENAFTLTFTTTESTIGVNANGLLNSFDASGAGNVGTTLLPIPETSTLTSLGMMTGLTFLFLIRKKRTKREDRL